MSWRFMHRYDFKFHSQNDFRTFKLVSRDIFTSWQEMGDHNIDEDAKAVPELKRSYEEPGLAPQIGRTSPKDA